ncbi:glycoside hydrolase family 3 N-terminal domain-containing protein [Gemmiger sp.]
MSKAKTPKPIARRVCMGASAAFLAVAVVGTGVLSTMASSVDAFVGTPQVHMTDEQKNANLAEASALAAQAEAEATVLLQNKDNTLPLSSDVKKVNVFGWASTAWLVGGSGSGQVTSVDVDFLQALNNYGIEYNTELTDMYKNFQDGREYTQTLFSWPEQSGRLYEPDINNQTYYTQAMLDNAKNFSDTAVVVIGRLAGESNDATKQQYKRTEKDGDIVVDDTRTMLELTTEEEDLLNYVGANYKNVIVLINSTNIMELGQIETIPGVDACLMVGTTGSDGASVLPAVLWGEKEPGGCTADTWAYDMSTAASYANAGMEGVGAYTNADGLYPMDGTTMGNLGEQNYEYPQVSYVDYAEDIYVGYKWYETADTEGYWDEVSNEYGTGYDGVVQYPFGYGLSYTSFDWKVTDASANGSTLTKDGDVTVKVTVTNTGDRAGKDVVELYYTAPYIAGEIEKSSVELGAFAKTDELQPGESQELTLTIPVEDMASYDAYDANHNGFTGYELDAGDYIFTVRHNAHDVDDDANATITCSLPANVQYPTDSVTGAEVNNKFTGSDAIDGVSIDGSDSAQNITYLTRADFAGTFPKANTPSRAMTDNVKALNLYTADMADAYIDENDEPITTGAKNGLKLEENGKTTDLAYQLGSDYNDPQWDALLDQLTVDEMENMYINGYGNTAKMDSISKIQGTDTDGPAQVGSWGRAAGKTVGFPNSATIAQTWNTALVVEIGHSHGKQALQNNYSGLYAPAANMHRSPFNGRNYEYYSEDSFLSGEMCGSAVQGIQEMGVYVYIKHFICNDGESGIYRDSVYTWMTEQALREVYLKPFKAMIQKYDATGLMSSYNRIGAVWAGGSEALLTGVLRDEWGFNGAVITDYADHHSFMNGDQALRAGGSLWMAGFGGGEMAFETSSNSYMQALRRATKQVLYMYLHVRAINRDYSNAINDTSVLRPEFKASLANWRVLLAVIDVVAVVLFILALRALLEDRKLRKAAEKKNS